VGIIGAIIAAIADIVCVVIFVLGVNIEKKSTLSMLLFAIINAVIGLVISILLRYQGQKYAEIENDDLVKKYYRKKVRTKKYISTELWNFLCGIKDFIFKGIGTTVSIFGIVYISIEGSKQPIQILITLVTLLLFACSGLINMNSSYCRYYNIQIPYMEKEIEERSVKEDVADKR